MHNTAGQHAEGQLASRNIALCSVRRTRRRQSMTQRNRNVSSNDSHNQPGDVEEIFRTSDAREVYGSGLSDIEVTVLT
jgi:hypothetical protein